MVQLRIVVHVQERKTQPFIRIFIEHNFLFAQKHLSIILDIYKGMCRMERHKPE